MEKKKKKRKKEKAHWIRYGPVFHTTATLLSNKTLAPFSLFLALFACVVFVLPFISLPANQDKLLLPCTYSSPPTHPKIFCPLEQLDDWIIVLGKQLRSELKYGTGRSFNLPVP
ncbi:hypothetical protein ACLB2K_061582 [Fragaria x ananassa]